MAVIRCVVAGVRVVWVPFCSGVVDWECSAVLFMGDYVLACGCVSLMGGVVVIP